MHAGLTGDSANNAESTTLKINHDIENEIDESGSRTNKKIAEKAALEGCEAGIIGDRTIRGHHETAAPTPE